MIGRTLPNHGASAPKDVELPDRPSARRVRHWLRLEWTLPVLALVALQTTLVFREQIFSPVDELQHVDYVRTIALDGRLPVYGDAQVDLGLLALFHHDTTDRPTAAQLAQDPRYLKVSYEAVQFPAYYLAAAPVYRVLSGDVRAAIYSLRMLNVLLSAGTLVALILLLRRVFLLRHLIAVMIGLSLLTVPGVALRDSQVTNQVMAMLVITLLLLALVTTTVSHTRRRMFGEGMLLGLGVMTKLTAIAVLPAAVVAWFRRRTGAWSLPAAAAGTAIPVVPWLLWAVPTYGQPVPFLNRHLTLWDPASYAAPVSAHGWLIFLTSLVHYFAYPLEWQAPSGWHLLGHMAAAIALIALVVAIAWSAAHALRAASQPAQAIRLALLMLAGTVGGYVVFAAGLHRVSIVDSRELYLFVGALALPLGFLATKLGDRLAAALFCGLIVMWLLNDVGLFVFGACTRC